MSHKRIFVILCVFMVAFQSFGQDKGVGIGTKNPQASLHIKGISNPAGSGIRTLLNENFDFYTVEQFGSVSGNCYTNGWVVGNTAPESYTCNECTGMMLFINSNSPNPRNCVQDQTAVVHFAIAPSTNSIDISFTARLQVYEITDRLYVYLYNETTETQVAVLATYQSSEPQKKIEINYTETQSVVIGNNYSLHFRYKAVDGWGATVDNVLVTENTTTAPSSYVFRLVDGTQGEGKVLTAGDAKGYAYWTTLSSPRSSSSKAVLKKVSKNDSNRLLNDIQGLQAIIDEQEAVFVAQSQKMKQLEEKLKSLIDEED